MSICKYCIGTQEINKGMPPLAGRHLTFCGGSTLLILVICSNKRGQCFCEALLLAEGVWLFDLMFKIKEGILLSPQMMQLEILLNYRSKSTNGRE